MKKIVLILTIATLTVSCGSKKQVSRIGRNEMVDLSGKWNDTDSRLVAEEMVNSMMSSAWITRFVKDNGRNPVVIVGKVRNKTDEHISTSTFTKDLEKVLINSGMVDFVASNEERAQVRDERKDQQSNASMETAKQMVNETGADYMLSGDIVSMTDAIEGEKIKYYQTSLELIHIESNKKSWIGDKKIKKYIAQDKYKS